MPTFGQKVALAALSHLGVVENPWDSNTDGGGYIDQIEKVWGLHGQPWCAMAVADWYKEAGVDMQGVASPSTAVMCDRARSKGWLHQSGRMPTGAIMILCGTHTEVVVNDRGNGLIDCCGGNVNQQVMKTVRQLGGSWQGIVIPGILHGTVEAITVYGFDDLHFAPAQYGPWHDKEAREKAIASLPKSEQLFVRRIRLHGTNQFAFQVVSPSQWRFGPWEDKATRDSLMHRRQRTFGRSMRPWSQKVSHPGDVIGGVGTGGVTSGETTT